MTKEKIDSIREKFNYLKEKCFAFNRHSFITAALISEIPELLEALEQKECKLIKMKSCERGKEYFACSNCKSFIWHDNEYFCYNCGAKIIRGDS